MVSWDNRDILSDMMEIMIFFCYKGCVRFLERLYSLKYLESFPFLSFNYRESLVLL